MRKRIVQPQPIASPTISRTGLTLRRCACAAHSNVGVDGLCADCRSTRLQRAASGAAPLTAPPIVSDVLNSSGETLDADTRALMENRFGHDFSRVRVHTDSKAADSVRAVSALAYTVGQNIAFGTGQYAPHTAHGRRLLAHELTHVVQQSGQSQTGHPPVIAPEDHSETQAQHVAQAVMSGPAPQIAPSPTALQRQFFTTRKRIAVGSVKPGPGITLSWSGNYVHANADLEIYGAEASATVAQEIQDSINYYWNWKFVSGYGISCDATVTYRAAGTAENPSASQIEIYRGTRDSFVKRFWNVGSKYMYLNLANGTKWTPAHEFGHLMGLPDAYSEGILSKISGRFGGERSVTAMPGYEHNIMGAHEGSTQAKNVKDLLDIWAYEDVPVGLEDPGLTPQGA